ncbi:peripheral-type benzodiazepine receptor-associated protein 1 [Rhinatrema bivittatum]|uniref:peripheral-type benzodiazepine receptor-associated protein 1 n=1 Tax=Rhinatrema bivittatum TaxID=194408 RepID=UPI00112EE8AA|nr:peripheral-type benzodiazepine receptor-associated protein 1 [Rhinatrema bivittatum]
MKKDSANSSRFSPKKSDSILLDECRREIEQLRGDLESERLRHHEIQRRFACEVKEIKETTEKEKHKLADDLRSKWELQKTRDLKQLKDLLVREREAEIRQLLRWKDAELRELQSVLEKEREAAVRQARELQKQLTEELLNKGYAGKAGILKRLSEPARSVECHCKLQEVLSKLRWDFDGEQAAQIRHLKVELELERNLFLKYILEGSNWDFTALLKQSNTKSLSSGLKEVKFEHSCLDIMTARPHSLESMISRPRSTENATSRPRSLDSIFAKSECTECILVDATVMPGSPDRYPQTKSSVRFNATEIDSSMKIAHNEESHEHLDSEFQIFQVLPDCPGAQVESWNFQSSRGMHWLGKDFKAMEQTLSSQVDMAEQLVQQSHQLSVPPPSSSVLVENIRAQEEDGSCNSLVKQNSDLMHALEELQCRCTILQEENSLLRKGYFPGTEEKVKRLKRKNAELAVIAKRLEERARNLQEANLKMVNIPIHLKGSNLDLCKKVFARQRAKDMMEQASALLAKDKQIEALQQECRELQAKITMGKQTSNRLHLSDFDHLLRESQKEVLRLQRQIAVKYLKETFHISKTGSRESLPTTVVCASISQSSIHREDEAMTSPKPSIGTTVKEFELHKKRKECENLEQEVKKKHKKCEELEIKLQEVQSENAQLVEENSRLTGKAKWTDKVESENADLTIQLINVTRERDSAVQETHQLQSKLENLEQVLKHMREVVERRQQLEKEHDEALIILRGKQEEVNRLHQAQVEAKKEHEGAVLLLEARVRDLEEKCRSQTEQFSFTVTRAQTFLAANRKRSFDLYSSDFRTANRSLLFHTKSSIMTSEIKGIHAFVKMQSNPRLDPYIPDDPAPGPSRSTHGHPPPGSPTYGDSDYSEEDDELLSVTSIEHRKIIEDGTTRVEGLPEPPNTYIRKLSTENDSTKEKQAKKTDSLPILSKSPQNSPKSCHSEVDTASEMEELDVDSMSLTPESEDRAPAKLQVFLARYSYNPFDGPNENPEAELPLTAGEYIYIYGEMDDDGFYEGELMDGRRGLVPSNFIEQVSDDLMTFQPPEGNDLSHSSCQEISFLSGSISSVERSDLPDEEETSLSPLPNCLQEERDECGDHIAVPYPRKLSLIKQLSRSIVVGWEPPLLPAGWGNVQSYNIYVDRELRQNVRFGSQNKALIEKLDLKMKTYRISVQSVTEKGNSDKLRCSFLIGFGFSIAPTELRVRDISATSAEITWFPSNSNYTHAIFLNEEVCAITKAGTYWYTFRNLSPNTQYKVKVESRPHKTPWELPPERREQKSTVIQFTTPSAGPPDAPLDVQVELGPSHGILLISWLPVTIDAAGTSNGVRVTGYAVYADGQKVLEVTSPTAGSVLVGMAHLQLLQLSQEVSVRTMSPHGESVDSVPAQIPSAFLKVSDCYSQVLDASSLSYELSCGESSELQPARIPPTLLTSSHSLPHNMSTVISNTKFTIHTSSNCVDSVDPLSVQVSSHLISSLNASMVHSPGISNPVSLTLGDDLKDGCHMSIQQPTAKNLLPQPEFSARPSEEIAIARITFDQDTNKQQGIMSQEEISKKGNWQLNSLDHTRSSDLSDILEEEEEEEDPSVEMQNVKREQREPVGNGERVGKMGVRGDPKLQLPGPSVDSISENLKTEMLDMSENSDSVSEISDVTKSGISEVMTISECREAVNNSTRVFLAHFDYNPQTMSPNANAAEEELPFKAGQILKVHGDKDADGFYHGECAGRIGLIPCNMVSEVHVENDDIRKQLLSQACAGISLENLVEITTSNDSKKCLPEQSRCINKEDMKAARTMVAIFDYNPREDSPNLDVEAELTFNAGDVITVFGDMDDDGFFFGELNGHRGFIPSNFLEATSLNGKGLMGALSEDREETQLRFMSSGDLNESSHNSSDEPSFPSPSQELMVEQTPHRLKTIDMSSHTTRKKGFFFKGKQLFKKLGSSKKE